MARAAQPSPAVPEIDDNRLGFSETIVTYKDGRSETIYPDNPQVVFRAGTLGLAELEQTPDGQMRSPFVLAWLAAGSPGLNGNHLEQQVALELTDEWLGTIRTMQRGNPTNRAQRRK